MAWNWLDENDWNLNNAIYLGAKRSLNTDKLMCIDIPNLIAIYTLNLYDHIRRVTIMLISIFLDNKKRPQEYKITQRWA